MDVDRRNMTTMMMMMGKMEDFLELPVLLAVVWKMVVPYSSSSSWMILWEVANYHVVGLTNDIKDRHFLGK